MDYHALFESMFYHDSMLFSWLHGISKHCSLAHLHQLSRQRYSTTKYSNSIAAYAKNSPYHTGQEYAIHELFL